MTKSEQYLREKSLHRAEGESGGKPQKTDETVSYGDTRHPAVMAQDSEAMRPRSRQYGDSNAPINDDVAAIELAKCRKLLGMRPTE